MEDSPEYLRFRQDLLQSMQEGRIAAYFSELRQDVSQCCLHDIERHHEQFKAERKHAKTPEEVSEIKYRRRQWVKSTAWQLWPRSPGFFFYIYIYMVRKHIYIYMCIYICIYIYIYIIRIYIYIYIYTYIYI